MYQRFVEGSSIESWPAWIGPIGLVCESSDHGYQVGSFESEGSERRSLGSVHIAPDAHWCATPTVPIPPRAVVFLEVQRQGDLPADYRGAEESAMLSLPIGEIDALIELLTGVVAQARRDGVLPAQ